MRKYHGQRVYTPDGPAWLVDERAETRRVGGRPKRRVWLLVEFADGKRREYNPDQIFDTPVRLLVDEEGDRA